MYSYIQYNQDLVFKLYTVVSNATAEFFGEKSGC